jgi:hypothetical protein
MEKKILADKKPWQKPELIILVRSNPEETVLGTCKFNTVHLAGRRPGLSCLGGGKPCEKINSS